ncbi:eag [Symbiodinium natans]|uniref:Eag protein n=1 Tax=Symbiodinium natans TaxID=878477 RepID=A0A812QMP7_9DINO|nr:eag [Symbiodinium natans]
MHLQKTHVEDRYLVRFLETVQLKVKAYLRYIFDRRRIHAKEAALINFLPDQLKGQIRRSQVRMYLERIPLMRELERDSIEKICDAAETFDLMQGDAVSNAGTVADAAWVLVSGRLRVTKRLVGQTESLNTNASIVSPLIVDEHCLEEDGPVLSRCTTLAAESSELIRVGKEHFFQSISVNRRKSLNLRGTALYAVNHHQSMGSFDQASTPSGARGRRGSTVTVSHAVQAAAVISSS